MLTAEHVLLPHIMLLSYMAIIQVNRTPDNPTSPTHADWATSVEHTIKIFDS